MRRIGNSFELSATDLVGYLNCRHLSGLDRVVAEGALAKPKLWDPLLQILWERGSVHEQNYVDHLAKAGLEVVRIDGVDVTDQAAAQTLAAMTRGVQVIVQGALSHGDWRGRADILRRVETKSAIGNWSYEPVDTKLARETRAGSVLQLCLYSDLLTRLQGVAPEHMHIVIPWSDFEPQTYRYADYAAYFRKVKRGFLASLAGAPQEIYPDPVEHCEICRWRERCEQRRREDDYLCIVAGISKLQINELKARGVTTMQALAGVKLPLEWKPERGSPASYVRIREQARLQVQARKSGKPIFEPLPVEKGFGLCRLPEPCEGDIFLDLEGDPFVGESGLEYLFGYLFTDDTRKPAYRSEWAFSREQEKRAFESFVDFAMARWVKYPAMHIYHYAPYEPAALKGLMGRYATREEELDRILRAKLFVDLYHVVRQGIRGGVESYSIKVLEPFYNFTRTTPLAEANAALLNIQACLELDHLSLIKQGAKATVSGYNKDDCHSAAALRGWLEELRQQHIAHGVDVPRPVPGDGAPNERITEWLIRINALIESLTVGIPADPAERDEDQQARWLLAGIIDWHRREEKAVWWDYFRLCDLSVEDLLDERAGLSGLSFVGEAGGTARAPIHRYRFFPQETEIRGEEEDLHNVGGAKLGKAVAISFDNFTVDIKKRQDSVGIHPKGVFAHSFVGGKPMAESLARIGEYVADHDLCGDGPYQAARDLLLRTGPRVGGEPLRQEGETAVDAAARLCLHLQGGILPIQGPPGAGKTFTGARMICELARAGKKVGITANSHKVIRHLIDETIRAADENGAPVQCCQKADEVEAPQHRLTFARRNEDLLAALASGTPVGGGTAWLWSEPDAFEAVDVLFVDEAAQMSLANVLALSQAAKTVVLIGDPQQLEQPMQGSHPEGTDVSALDHILAGAQTIPPDKGLFLEETWRLHPRICEYTSELFYESKLRSLPSLERQKINAAGPVSGSGLRYLSVEHSGNQNCSPEEAEAVSKLINAILAGKATWTDRHGQERPLTLEDVLIIAPYNAQVFEIQQKLPGARVGTVDKFQGQQAPIAIYSTATSSHSDAPRGMEFLYSQNRLNVATSRARCLSILIASPQLFEAECRTPHQIKLANGFCRFLEIAEELRL